MVWEFYNLIRKSNFVKSKFEKVKISRNAILTVLNTLDFEF